MEEHPGPPDPLAEYIDRILNDEAWASTAVEAATHIRQVLGFSNYQQRRRAETFVRADPSVHFGRPTVGGIPVDSLTENIWAGDPVEHVAEGYNLTVPQVLVACWFKALYGGPTWRKRWAVWLAESEEHFWNARPERVGDPPSGGGRG